MTKSEANEYCLRNGYELFIDFCMREKVVIEPDPPELSKEMQAICAIMIEIEVRSGPDYDKKYVAYPSEYGAGCLIDGLRNKGYEIVKINQK